MALQTNHSLPSTNNNIKQHTHTFELLIAVICHVMTSTRKKTCNSPRETMKFTSLKWPHKNAKDTYGGQELTECPKTNSERPNHWQRTFTEDCSDIIPRNGVKRDLHCISCTRHRRQAGALGHSVGLIKWRPRLQVGWPLRWGWWCGTRGAWRAWMRWWPITFNLNGVAFLVLHGDVHHW